MLVHTIHHKGRNSLKRERKIRVMQDPTTIVSNNTNDVIATTTTRNNNNNNINNNNNNSSITSYIGSWFRSRSGYEEARTIEEVLHVGQVRQQQHHHHVGSNGGVIIRSEPDLLLISDNDNPNPSCDNDNNNTSTNSSIISNRNDYDDDNDDNDVIGISIDEAIERLGYGMFQRTILGAAGLCFAADAMQIMLLSFLTGQLKIEWKLQPNQTASLTSAIFAGAFSGTLLLGPCADRIGRRSIFLLCATIIVMFSLIGMALLTPDNGYITLLVMIYGVGFGVGGLTVPFDIFAECLPAHGRGQQLLIIEYFWSIGGMLVVVVANYTIEHHWRIFVAICSIPCILSIGLGYIYVPESPRWLVSKGRTVEALAILRLAALRNGYTQDYIDTYMFPPNLCLLESESIEHNASLSDLFQPKWRYTTIRLWGTWACMAFGYYGTILAVTRVFESSASSPHDNDNNNDTTNDTRSSDFDYSAIFVSSLAEIIGTTFIVLAVDRIGRIPTQVISYGSAGLSVCLLTILGGKMKAHNLTGGNSSILMSRTLLVVLGFVARVFEMAGSCVTWVMTAEILTTDVRGTGHSTANAMGRVGAFSCPFVVENQSLIRVGWIMLIVHCCTVLFVSTLPETAEQQIGGSTGTTSPPINRTRRTSSGSIPAVENEHNDGSIINDEVYENHNHIIIHERRHRRIV